MSRRPFRIRLAMITSAIVVAAVALLWCSSAGRSLSAPLSPSELLSKRPSGTVRVAGVVVSSETDNSGLAVVVADASAPEVGVLTLRYTGAQRVSFGPGAVVMAFGRLMPDGVFGVDEFVVKRSPRSRG